jgi:hypothetical protein
MLSFNPITSPFMMPFYAPFGSIPSMSMLSLPFSLPISRGEIRSHSPTHPKLQSRDPPIPPTLVKKRWSNTVSGPIFPQPSHSSHAVHSRKRSHSSASLKRPANGSEELGSSRLSRDPWVQERSTVQCDTDCAVASRRSSPSRDPSVSRLGTESAVVYPSVSRSCADDAPSSRPARLDRSAPVVSDIVALCPPEPFPQLPSDDAGAIRVGAE